MGMSHVCVCVSENIVVHMSSCVCDSVRVSVGVCAVSCVTMCERLRVPRTCGDETVPKAPLSFSNTAISHQHKP